MIKVRPESPAAGGDLIVGDVIIGINGKALKTMNAEERKSALRGSPIVLLVRRDDVEKVVQLSLE
ncbi:MAG: C-terminal processing protease CtpA/Prc [Candidatus Krumholzibacteriia bacterium]